MLNAEDVSSVLNAAMIHGADFAEIYVEDRSSTAISLEDRRVEEISNGISRGAGIRVIYGETTGFAHTSDLSLASLLQAAETARAVAQGSVTKTIALPTSAVEHRGFEGPSDTGAMKAKSVELLLGLDDVARSQGHEITQVTAGISSATKHFLVANTNGIFHTDMTQRTRCGVSVVARGDGGLQTGYEPAALTLGFSDFLDQVDIEDLARTAGVRAIAKLSARPAPSGTMPVILKGGSGGILFHEACGHGLEADHIVKNASVYTGRIGEMVASPLVTLVDDGTVGHSWGTYGIDDEGHESRRNVLIEDGILTDYLWDYLSAKKAGRLGSGNGRRQSYQHLPMVRMTNTFLLGGAEDPEEIIAQTPRGVYVTALTGGQVNTATGDFVFGTQEAYLIEDGHLTTPLRDTQLIGNGPEVLSKIDAVANDFAMTPGTCGKMGQSVPVGTGQATLRITEMTLGGTANG